MVWSSMKLVGYGGRPQLITHLLPCGQISLLLHESFEEEELGDGVKLNGTSSWVLEEDGLGSQLITHPSASGQISPLHPKDYVQVSWLFFHKSTITLCPFSPLLP